MSRILMETHLCNCYCYDMSKETGSVQEVVQRQGYIFDEIKIYPILCKPKLMPLKSVTLQKLERMQKEAQEKMLLLQQQQQKESKKNEETMASGDTDEFKRGKANEIAKNVDVWKPENDTEEMGPSS